MLRTVPLANRGAGAEVLRGPAWLGVSIERASLLSRRRTSHRLEAVSEFRGY